MSGFGKSMRGNDSEKRARFNEFEERRGDLENRLVEKWGKVEGLGLDGGKMDSLYEENPAKAIGLSMFLENTQKHLSRLSEYQTSSFLGITPQEIVKISRIAYPNAIMSDIFSVWSMESVKDTFYKLETKYGSTARGATEGQVTYETYNDGRYPSEIVEDEQAGDGGANYTGTMSTIPVRPYQMKVFINDNQVGVDDGSGVFVGSVFHASTPSTINYTTGAFDITFAANYTSADTIRVEAAYNSEIESNFDEQGTVTLDLVAYDFRAKFFSLNVAWHRMAEEIAQSKLNTSARATLIQAAGELMVKSMDELAMKYGKAAANWTSAVTFDTDFATAGADSSYARAQDIIDEGIDRVTAKAYNDLGRYAGMYNLVCGTKAASYLTKHNQYQAGASASRVGMHKVGKLGDMGVFKAPSNIVADNMIYVFGKGTDAMSVDSPVSIGTYRLGLATEDLTYASFKTEKGLGAMADFRINNAKFSGRLQLDNL